MTTTETAAPTCEDLIDCDGFKVVSESSTPWRHGTYETTVFLRDSDGTFWQAVYCLGADGEHNGLREGFAEISQVYPRSKIVTVYTPTPEQPENA